ncbi:MAG: hypothetical protein AABW50_03595, partial [Nanoarchaeota archaeon]
MKKRERRAKIFNVFSLILLVIVVIELLFISNFVNMGNAVKNVVQKSAVDMAKSSTAKVPACAPTAEICDGKDNDCDKLVDEEGVCDVKVLKSSQSYTKIPIATGTPDQTEPQIFGNTIVWMERFAGSSAYSIKMFNITSQQTSTLISLSSPSDYDIPIDLFGNLLVTIEVYPPGHIGFYYDNVITYNINNGVKSYITSSTGSSGYYNPRIFGNKIIFGRRPLPPGFPDDPLKMYSYDLSSGQTVLMHNLTSGFGDVGKYFAGWSDGSCYVSLYNLTFKYITKIGDGGLNNCSKISSWYFQAFPPVIGDDWVFFMERDYLTSELMSLVYNINDQTVYKFYSAYNYSINDLNIRDYEIWDDKIAWVNYTNWNSDIYIYDISKNTTIPITKDSYAQSRPRVYEDKVVWQDYENGNWDIYMAEIPSPYEVQPVHDGSISKISGGGFYVDTGSDSLSVEILSAFIETRSYLKFNLTGTNSDIEELHLTKTFGGSNGYCPQLFKINDYGNLQTNDWNGANSQFITTLPCNEDAIVDVSNYVTPNTINAFMIKGENITTDFISYGSMENFLNNPYIKINSYVCGDA